jgi:ribosomal protein S18 acetylase RimI-like enzyme
VELRARASNQQALALYRSLGFVEEGRFTGRIRARDGSFEDGIPMVWFNPGWKPQARIKPFAEL